METRVPPRTAPLQSAQPKKQSTALGMRAGTIGADSARNPANESRWFGRTKRQLLNSTHTWIGIIAGAFISVMALTGSVTVFREEIERATVPGAAPAAEASKRVDPDQAARQAIQFRPNAHIRRVRFPAVAGRSYIFQLESGGKRTEQVVVDASSGRILGTLQTGWVDWMIDLHRNLLSGKPGRATVGAFGILLFTLSLTGILMWLTGARNWKAWVSRPKGSSIRFNYELHRLSGLWAYGFLAAISFTGVGLAYPDAFRQVVQALTGPSTAVRPPKKIKSDSLRPLDEYLQAGHSAMPDAVATEIRLPAPGRGPVELRLHRAGDLAPAGNRVYLDPSTAAVLIVDRLADRPLGARFLASLAPIHYGEFGGVPIKAAWSLFALTPVLLFITGTIAWWRRAKRKWLTPVSRQAAGKPLVLAGR